MEETDSFLLPHFKSPEDEAGAGDEDQKSEFIKSIKFTGEGKKEKRKEEKEAGNEQRKSFVDDFINRQRFKRKG